MVSAAQVLPQASLRISMPPDERPGDYLPDSPYALSRPHVTRDRYPEPAQGDLVTFWQRQGRAVLSVTSSGHTQDFYIAPNVVSLMAREAVELLAHSTNLRG